MITKKRKMLLISLVLLVTAFFIFFNNMNKKNKILNDEDIYNEKFYHKELDEKMIGYNKDNFKIVTNQIILETDKSLKKDIENIIKKYGGKIVGYIEITHTYQIEFDKVKNLEEIKEKLEKNKHIIHVAYNYIISMSNQKIEYPNDENWKNDWSTTPNGNNWGLEAIDMVKVWNYLSNKKLNNINIGIFECNGLQEDHGDIKENMHSTLDNLSTASRNHGTEVTGIIAARYNNSIGISGITMNKAKIDFFSCFGAKKQNYNDIMSFKIGLTYLVMQAKDNNQTAIINMSLGDELLNISASYGNEVAINELNIFNNEFEKYLKILLKNGYDFLIVKGADNTNLYQYLKVDYDEKHLEDTKYGYVLYTTNKSSDEYKKYKYLYKKYKKELKDRLVQGNCNAQYDIFSGIEEQEIKDRIIVVGATENVGDSQYKLSDWYSVCGSRVDILAPGTYIESTTSNNEYSKADGNFGTSLSTPHVTGVACLILSIDPTISGDKLKNILIQSGTGEYKASITKHSDKSKEECNYSMLNAYNAVRIAENQSKKDIAYKEYAKKFKKYQNKYGQIKEIYVEQSSLNMQLEGLCYAKLIDFNNDGLDEMILVYKEGTDTGNYHYDIFGYEDNKIKLLESSKESYQELIDSEIDYTSELYSLDAGQTFLYMSKLDNKYYIRSGMADSFEYNFYHGYDNDCKFGIQESMIIDYENSTFLKNGKDEKFESVDKEKNKFKNILELPLENYTYSNQSSSNNINSLDIALSDINETIEKLNIGEKIDKSSEYDSAREISNNNEFNQTYINDHSNESNNGINVEGTWYSSDGNYIMRIGEMGWDHFRMVDMEYLYVERGTIKVNSISSFKAIFRESTIRPFDFTVISNNHLIGNGIDFYKADENLANAFISTWRDEYGTVKFNENKETYELDASYASYWGYWYVINDHEIILTKYNDYVKKCKYHMVNNQLVIDDWVNVWNLTSD